MERFFIRISKINLMRLRFFKEKPVARIPAGRQAGIRAEFGSTFKESLPDI
ncbi:MAG: hypothetical protein KAS51_03640 [Candidatus Omnitrophica bacterium]|nr:hypothetical protein [Candidatus Omnitrophota bacterium]